MSLDKQNFLSLLSNIDIESHVCDLIEKNIEVRELKFEKEKKRIIVTLKQLIITDINILKKIEFCAQKSRFQIILKWLKQFKWKSELKILKGYIDYFYQIKYPAQKINFDLKINEENEILKINFETLAKDKIINDKKEIQEFYEKYGLVIPKIEIDSPEKEKENNKEQFKEFHDSIQKEKNRIVKQYIESQKQIKGKVLSVEEKIVPEGQVFDILLETTNKTWIVKWTKKDDQQNSDILKKYTYIKFKGRADQRGREIFYADYFEEIPVILKRLDLAEKKRVELHVHTKMSALDGIGDIEEYLTYASKWNHKAIAFTDHQNIHAFPELTKASEKYPNLKIIYGCEFEFLPKGGWVISKEIKDKIADQKIVFFDIETTGLSANFHEIIEFAAIVTENNLIKQSETFLIQCNNEIPKNIQEITKITTSEHQKNAIPFKEAIEKIRKIFKNAILVAQNINFDISFINKAFQKQGWNEIQNPMIDILNLSRFLNPESKQHNLKRIAKRYKVYYSQLNAHRANHDTEIVHKIFETILFKHNLKYLDELWKMNEDFNIRKKMFSRHINVLVKNKKGLRSLYHLISQTHTKNLYRKPVLEKKELEKHKENLLIGAGCWNSEVFHNACFENQEKLEKSMLFYDYIEIQPLEIYKHLIEKEIINQANLKSIIKNIIETAEKLNKMVVASGDVHYLEPEHRFYRDIFVFNKQLGGFYHNLYDSKKRIKKTPLQHFRTTDEMLKAFNFLGEKKAFDIVVENSNKIADQIEKVKCFDKEFIMPKIPNDKERLTNIAKEKLWQKYGKKPETKLQKRFDEELEKIINSGYSTIYLISYHLTDYSLKKGYLFSSRGSVGSSFLAYCLDITEVNPLKPHYHCEKCFYFEWTKNPAILSGFDLPKKECPNCRNPLNKNGHEIAFESFLGINAETIPDIDLNFSGLFQQEAQKFVLNFLTKELGEQKIFWTGTVNTIAKRSAYSYYKNFLESKEIKEEDSFSEVQKTLFYCSGIKKTTGQHPGGLIIVPKEREILDFTPYNFPSNNPESYNYTTHFDYHVLKNQLLKIDVLGHDDPTGLKMLEKMTNINPKKIDLGDQKIIKLFCDTEVLKIRKEGNSFIKKNGALGLPEFGTKFVLKMLIDIKVKSFANLISVSGLSHGKNLWENNAKTLIQEKNFSIQDVISSRDDILLFLIKSGFDKTLAFKIMNKVKKGKPLSFEEEKAMKKQKIPYWYIESCRKIRYLFPKAHATAYVIMACRFAWFKIYYPHEFYATYFSIRCDVFDLETIISGPQEIEAKYQVLLKKLKSWNNKEKISTKEKNLMPIYEISMEMWARNIKIKNLDLNLSESNQFIVKESEKEKYIIPPFISIDGLGIEVANKIIEERKKGKFSSQEDFKKRTKVNQTVFEKLIKINLFKDLQKKDQNTFDFY